MPVCPSPSRRFKSWTLYSLVAVPFARIALVALGCCLLLAPAASAADYTWSGGGGSSANAWSNGANWVGGSAPAASSSIGNLTFPLLSGYAIAANDLSGLSINHLSIDDTNAYALNGQGFTLGSGGLSVSETAPGGTNAAQIFNPITLASSQEWDLSGEAKGQSVGISGALSGEAANLTVNLGNTSLNLGDNTPTPDDELGNVRVIGGVNQANVLLLDGNLDAKDGKTLTVENTDFETNKATGPLVGIHASLRLREGSSVGPLTSIGSHLVMGGILNVPSASFDAGSFIQFGLNGGGTQAGTDYTQLASTGAVNLGGATIELNGLGATIGSGICPTAQLGQVDTLVSTTGSLIGTFGNAPNGATITATECLNLGPHGEVLSESTPAFRIDYNTTSSPETVTATAVEQPASTGGSNGGGSTGGGSGTSSGSSSSTGSSGGSSPAVSIGAAQIAASLGLQLIPSGKVAKIGVLLKSGGLKMSFTALEAGTLSVQWYEMLAGSKLAKHSKAKPVLVASGQMTFSAAGAKTLRIRLTAAGRKLLKHAKSLRLTAKGIFTAAGQAPVGQKVSFALRH
jgi:hypothetical protein